MEVIQHNLQIHFVYTETYVSVTIGSSSLPEDRHQSINSSPPGKNGRHFPDDILKCMFMNEKFCIFIQIALKFAPKCPIKNIPVLLQIMAWRRSGDKPLSEPMLTQLTDAYMRH